MTFQDGDGSPSRKQAFDLAVLSVGIMPGADHEFFKEKLGLTLNADGFLERGNEVLSPDNGIFLAGTVRGPKGIAQSITEAYRTAEEIAAYLKTRPRG